MKISFKQFLKETILEDITMVDGKVRISTQHYKAGSNKDAISTYFRGQPYVTHLKGTEADIYSLLNYVTSDASTGALKALKSGNVNEKQFSTFMHDVKLAATIIVKRIKPDIIIYPKSSSPLLKQFVDEIHAAYPIAEVLSDRFIKVMLNAEKVETLINVDHPDWKKFAEENPKRVKELKQSLKTNIMKGELQMKKLYKPNLKFIKNFIELKDAYEVLEKVMDKNILVIDDILSSGSTMAEMIRQLKEFDPEKISGLTMFKHSTVTK